MVQELKELRINGLSAEAHVRLGISFGEAWLVGYGNAEEKRADLAGWAVEDAERVQNAGKRHQDKGVEITVSEAVAKQLRGSCSLLEGEKGICSLDRLDDADIVHSGEFMAHDIPTDTDLVQRAIYVRERYLSRTRRGELERQYTRCKEPRQDCTAISTVFVRIPALADRTLSYEQRNALMQKIFELAEMGRGKIDKLHHDVVMINFLAGTNDENSIEMALKLRDSLQELGVMDATMACSRSESFDLAFGAAHTVYGRGVVAARRMLDEANPGGGVVVDGGTHQYLGRMRLSGEELPPMRMRGFDQPVERYLITDMESAHLRLETNYEVIAREAELSEMRELYRRGGTLLMMSGENGIGKTALVTHFLQWLSKQGVYVAIGEAEAYTQRDAYAVFRNVCDQIFSLHRTDSMPERRNYVTEYFRTNRMEGEIEKLVLINEIVGTNFPETDKTKYMDPYDRRSEQARLMLKLFSSLKYIDRPAVIALENIQYWDERTIELMSRLAPRLKEAGVMVIATGTAIDRDGRGLSADKLGLASANTVEMNLSPLHVCLHDYDAVKIALAEAEQSKDVTKIELYKKQLEELNRWWVDNRETWYQVINRIIPIDRDDFDSNEPGWRRIILNVAGKTRGNFRYVEQVIYDLVIYKGKDRYFEEKEIIDSDGHRQMVYVLGSKRIQDAFFADIKEMEKLEEELINSLGDEGASLFRDECTIGRFFDVETLSFLSKLSVERILESLKVQQRYGLVRSHGQGVFEILRGQDAGYNSIGDVRLRQLKHRRLAHYFEKREPNNLPLLVRHFSNSDDYIKALYYLDKRSEQLKTQVLWKDALNHIERATQIFKKVRGRGWEVLDTSTEEPRPRTLSKQEIDELVDTQVARMFEAIKIWRLIGDRNKSSELALEAQALFRGIHSNFDEMVVHDQITWARFYREIGADKSQAATFDEALLSFQTCESLLEEIGHRLDNNELINGEHIQYKEALADLYNSWGWLYKRTSREPESLEMLQRGLSFAVSSEQEIRLLNGVALSHTALGDLGEADRVYGMAIQRARDLGQKGEIVTLTNNLAALRTRMGRLDDAEQMFIESGRLAQEIAKTSGINYADASLGIIQRIRGNYAAAIVRFERAATYYESRGAIPKAENIKNDVAFCCIMLGGAYIDNAKTLLASLKSSKIKRIAAQSIVLGSMLKLKEDGDSEGVRNDFNEGLSAIKELGELDDAAFYLLYFGELEILSGRVAAGVSKIKESRQISVEINELSEMPRIDALLSKYSHLAA
jgi:class 3 adenylate cyclase/tetratricopeptide (TPR) repeat protein